MHVQEFCCPTSAFYTLSFLLWLTRVLAAVFALEADGMSAHIEMSAHIGIKALVVWVQHAGRAASPRGDTKTPR